MITNGSYPDLVVLDVRAQSEYDSGHIYGAVWIPHTELETRIDELAGHENHEIIVYCLSGGRSVTASVILDSYNFTKVYNMLAGILAWESKGYPVWIATVHNVNSTFNYDTIQAAIDAPQTRDGHTILVGIGKYHENVVVDKSISLIGENRNTTILAGGGTGSGTGISLSGRKNVIIKNITIRSFDYGIWLSMKCGEVCLGSINNTISGNNITNNGGGIVLTSSSDYNSIFGNDITMNNYFGILLGSSFSNSVSGNNITNNYNGIWLDDASNNHISANTFTENYNGIELSYSFDNKFYHNNLIDNILQVYIETPGYSNFWDSGYPFGGNYWSNYFDVDLYSGPFQNEIGSDGIGDTAYEIDANNQDNYPVIGTFSEFKATPEYYVQTICNSSISDFQFNGTAISFNVTGENDTTGFCRICIPTALMNVTYRVFVNGTEVTYDLLPCSNSTHSYLYFTYNLSTQEVIVIPEFPSFLILSLFMTATLVTVIVYRRKHSM